MLAANHAVNASQRNVRTASSHSSNTAARRALLLGAAGFLTLVAPSKSYAYGGQKQLAAMDEGVYMQVDQSE